MPGSDELFRIYLHEVSWIDIVTISSSMKDRPISNTINDSPEPCGLLAVVVIATFYDDELPGRTSLMIDLQIVSKCSVTQHQLAC